MLAGGRAEKTRTAEVRKADFAFSAILFSFLGWALLESWNLHIGATPMRHLISTLLGGSLMATSLLRFRAYAAHAWIATAARPSGGAGNRGFLVLVPIGLVLGIAAASTLVSVLAGLVIGFTYFPWSRFGAYKSGPIQPLRAIVCAAGLALFISPTRLTFMLALPIIWCLWTVAVVICLSLCSLELLRKRRRFPYG